MSEPAALPDDLGSTWAQRILARNQAELARIEDGQRSAQRLASAVDAPVEDWAQARETLGISGKGLDSSEKHANLRINRGG